MHHLIIVLSFITAQELNSKQLQRCDKVSCVYFGRAMKAVISETIKKMFFVDFDPTKSYYVQCK